MVDPTKPPPWSTTQVQCSENSNSEDLEELQWCPVTGTGIISPYGSRRVLVVRDIRRC
jgi:hypothetical protein